jgi:putative membrane protein
MKELANLLTGLVTLLHLGFMVLEMFLWTKPAGRKIFGTTEEFATKTATLAKNQGLYNGFLAAGLIWSFFIPEESFQISVRLFFLTCVLVAGIFGAITLKRLSVFWIQGLPAWIAILALLASVLAH